MIADHLQTTYASENVFDQIAMYSVKEAEVTVNHLSTDSRGALPRMATKCLCRLAEDRCPLKA